MDLNLIYRITKLTSRTTRLAASAVLSGALLVPLATVPTASSAAADPQDELVQPTDPCLNPDTCPIPPPPPPPEECDPEIEECEPPGEPDPEPDPDPDPDPVPGPGTGVTQAAEPVVGRPAFTG